MKSYMMELVLTVVIVAILLAAILFTIALLCKRCAPPVQTADLSSPIHHWSAVCQLTLHRLLHKFGGTWDKRGQRNSEENAILTNHEFCEEYTEPFTPEISSQLAHLNLSSPEAIRLPPSPLGRNGNFRKFTNGFVTTSSFSDLAQPGKRHSLACLGMGIEHDVTHHKNGKPKLGTGREDLDRCKYVRPKAVIPLALNGGIKPPPDRRMSHRRKSSSGRRHSRTLNGNNFKNYYVDDPEQLGIIPTRIKKAISCESVESIYSECESPIRKMQSIDLGSLEFTLQYDAKNQGLTIQILGARNLQIHDQNAYKFCCFALYLDSTRDNVLRTQNRANLQDPIFGDRFFIPIPKNQIENQSLYFTLQLISDMGKQLVIGKCLVVLDELEIPEDRANSYWRIIEDCKVWQECGDILISLNYLPTAERLTIVIVKAKNLKLPKTINHWDTFVKVYLLMNGKKVSKKKTSLKKDEPNPIFNESMTFSVTSDELRETALKIVVLGENIFEESTFIIGQLMLGSKTQGKSNEHWNHMINSMRKPISMWHSLRQPKRKR